MTRPGPRTEAVDVIAIHGVSVVAVHVHDSPVSTETGGPSSAAGPTTARDGVIANVQSVEASRAACVMAYACPAIVTTLVRSPPSFASTRIVTVPPPLPRSPETMLIHVSVEDAVHAHPASAVTDTVAVPPSASIESTDGEILEPARRTLLPDKGVRAVDGHLPLPHRRRRVGGHAKLDAAVALSRGRCQAADPSGGGGRRPCAFRIGRDGDAPCAASRVEIRRWCRHRDLTLHRGRSGRRARRRSAACGDRCERDHAGEAERVAAELAASR